MTDASPISEAEGEFWFILAFIQPFKLDAVTLALEALPNVGGMSVSECRGFARRRVEEMPADGKREAQNEALAEGQTGHPLRRRYDTSDVADFSSKLRVEVVVAGHDVADSVATAIGAAARTGRPGDGKVLVWAIRHAIRIRTGESGTNAL